ncbi:hypothetical protein HEP87_60935 [Streptomyces sp. S1D4-11]
MRRARPVLRAHPAGPSLRAHPAQPALRALHAEWTKLRTLPSSWLLLAATVALTFAVGTAAVSRSAPASARVPWPVTRTR